MTIRSALLLFTSLGLLASATAHASGLRVQPLRLDFSSKQKAAELEIQNLTAEPMPVQLSAVSWSQADGSDQYEPTKDLFFAPPIVTVPPQSKTVVRFRLRGAVPDKAESAYRVYVEELTPPKTEPTVGMQFRLKLGIPVFVAPKAATRSKLDVDWEPREGGVVLKLRNDGTRHLKVEGIALLPATTDRKADSADTLASATHSTRQTNYLLPGTAHEFALDLPEGLSTADHVLLIRTNDYSGTPGSGIDERGWRWVDLGKPGPRKP